MPCTYCGRDDPLPFECNFCGQVFCAAHRLPEQHNCSEYWRVKLPRQEPITEKATTPTGSGYSTGYEFFFPSARPLTKRGLSFSSTEIRHIAVGAALVTFAGASFFPRGLFFSWLALGLAVSFFALGFLLHELAHKFVAQNYGLWAEFRVDKFGAMITLLTAFLPFKLIAPGAVMIQGPITKRAVGLTAIAGPLTNIAISVILLAASQYADSFAVAVAAASGASINAWLALFNMIPWGVFDGRKAFWWHKIAWGSVTGAALLLVIYLNSGLTL